MKPSLENLPKIYVKDPNLTSLEDLIRTCYNRSTDGSYFCETYKDPDFKNTQCRKDARRSFEDLLSISRTYFPETTELDLFSVLKNLEVSFYFCGGVRKIVFHFRGRFRIEEIEMAIGYYSNPLTYSQEETYSLQDLLEIKNIYENKL